jgi:hypothetical protein
MHAFFTAQIGIALAGQRAAVPRAQPHAQVDGGLLALHLPRALVGVGMREVRREAEHRGDLPGLAHGIEHGIHVLRGQARKEFVVVLEAFTSERGGVVNPLHVVHAAGYELIEVTLRKHGDAGSAPHIR